MPRKNGNSGCEERSAPAEVGEDDLDIWVATLLACDDEMRSGFERLVWDLFGAKLSFAI